MSIPIPPPKDDASGGDTTGTRPSLTSLRLAVSPYLPPPVVAAIRTVDSHPAIEAYVGDEASAAILSGLVLGFLLYKIAGALGGGKGGLRVADVITDDDVDGDDGAAKKDSGWRKGYDYGETVSLIGPSGGGKTALFRGLCYGDYQAGGAAKGGSFATVTSMRANVGLMTAASASSSASSSGSEEGGGGLLSLPVRLIDNPGHPALRSRSYPRLRDSDRVVLVLDATRPVGPAAEVLYDALTRTDVLEAWRRRSRRSGGDGKKKVEVLVCCSKSDLPGAKNWRRVKIQMRTELERMAKVRGAQRREAGSSSSYEDANGDNGDKGGGEAGGPPPPPPPFDLKGGRLDLDDAGSDCPVAFRFASIGAGDADAVDAIRKFALEGEAPPAAASAAGKKSAR